MICIFLMNSLVLIIEYIRLVLEEKELNILMGHMIKVINYLNQMREVKNYLVHMGHKGKWIWKSCLLKKLVVKLVEVI
jgi:hypothetical protein